jgi:hypothetical protein
VNKDWWISADNQERSTFTKGEGTVAVADPDEWDDGTHPNSGFATDDFFNTFLTTNEVSLAGVDPGSVQVQFDSSWRDECCDDGEAEANNQTATITVSYDDGPPVEILLWQSDQDLPNFKNDATNETIVLNLDNPAGASTMKLEFSLTNAANDWWWAIDNLRITASGGTAAGDYDNDGQLTAVDIDLLSAAVVAGSTDAKYDLDSDGTVSGADRDRWVHTLKNTYFGDADLDGEFSSGDLVQMLASGLYEADLPSGWASGDFNGDDRTDSSDLVVALSDGGYEAGPRAAVSSVPEPGGLMLLVLGGLVVLVRRPGPEAR